MTEHFTLQSAFNAISAIFTIPRASSPIPCVILSHGLLSSKESDKYTLLAERFVDEGYGVCRFDYHGCGESGGVIEETTLTKRLENLGCIVNEVRSRSTVDPARVAILGSSFGATSALLTAAKDRDIRCVSLWATPHRLDKKDGASVSGVLFRDTLFDDFAGYDILSEARKVTRALVIHGDHDETVPCQEGLDIFDRLAEPKACEIIPGGDHVFSDPLHRDRAVAKAVEWFGRFLR